MSVSRQAVFRKGLVLHSPSVKPTSLWRTPQSSAGGQVILVILSPLADFTLTVPPAGYHLASLLGIGVACSSHHLEYILYDSHIFHWEQMYRNKFTTQFFCVIFFYWDRLMRPHLKGVALWVLIKSSFCLTEGQIPDCGKLTKINTMQWASLAWELIWVPGLCSCRQISYHLTISWLVFQ